MSSVLTERQDEVLVVTLNRPESYNAFDRSINDGLAAAWLEAAEPDVRAVIITGAGPGFCAGADLFAGREGLDPATNTMRHTYHPRVLMLASLEKPVIAAVNGPAAGAGLALACAADVRIASTGARFVPAFARIGLVPDCGASYFIVRMLGYSKAFQWLGTARELNAQEAVEWGVASEVVEPDQLLTRALEVARTFTALPGFAVGKTKWLLDQALRNPLAQQLEHEVVLQDLAGKSEDAKAARQAMLVRLQQAQAAQQAAAQAQAGQTV